MIPITFQHTFELIPERTKFTVGTIFAIYDSAVMIFPCAIMKMGYSFGQSAEFTNYLGLAAAVGYMILIPESPKWLFLKQGPESR
jgi:hypothetical protein